MRNIREDKTHTEIIECCVQLLMDRAEYEESDVLTRTGHTLMAKSIQWLKIRRAIEADHGIRLTPVVRRWFHQRSKRYNPKHFDPHISPEKFLAGTGTGKRAAGYVIATRENGELILYRLQRAHAEARGKTEAAKQLAAEAAKVGVFPQTPAIMLSATEPTST